MPAAGEFPQGFLWGAATSSHQIEGGNHLNDWWDWEEKGKTKDKSGIACDSWNRYAEDFDLAVSMHHKAHRFSIEWSRIEPEEGKWDDVAIQHYQAVVGELKKRGLAPILTLHHFTNPRWMAAQGGWENPKSAEWFVRYVSKMSRMLGVDVHYWITINEPNVFAYKGYLEGDWPPGKQSFASISKVYRNMAKAHCLAYEAIHSTFAAQGWEKPMVGLAQHFLCAQPANPASLRDRIAATARLWFNNRLFLNRVGRKYLDYVGINYYFREIIEGKSNAKGMMRLIGNVVREERPDGFNERNDLGWNVYPPGLSEAIRTAKKLYDLPVMITENGTCTHDEDFRQRYIQSHLAEVKQCIGEGIQVLGYCYWSLLDNFEWSIGYSPKFGLVSVDPATLSRIPKASAGYYSQVCKTNAP